MTIMASRVPHLRPEDGATRARARFTSPEKVARASRTSSIANARRKGVSSVSLGAGGVAGECCTYSVYGSQPLRVRVSGVVFV